MNRIRFRAAQLRWRPDLALVLLVLWGLFIAYATMLPFDFSASREHVVATLRRLWYRPLKGGSWHDVYSNVLLFVPWGLLLGVWRAGRGTGYVLAMILALLTGGLLSGSVEISQLFAPTRSTSVIDVITNTFGSCVGALVGWPWARWVWPKLSVRIRQVIFSRPLAGCAVATLALLLIAGLSPFHVSVAPSDLRAALQGARLDPFGVLYHGTPRPDPWRWLAELLTWILAGGLFALAAQESRARGGQVIGWAVAIAASTSLAIEASHVMIPGREIDMTSVIIAVLGSAIGSVPVAMRAGDPRRLIPASLLIWSLAVMLAAWKPARFAWPDPPYLRAERIVPFWSYFDSRSLADLADVIGQALVFMPLGSLLGARSWRQSFAGACLIGLGVGFVLEVGQVFLPGRTADISDALSAAAGAGLGWGFWRWGEWARTSSMGAARYRVGQR